MADEEDLKLLMSGERDLSRCDFRGANLGGMDLRGRNFSHSLFQKAQCEGTKFDGSDFRHAQVSFMKAKDASFDGCKLEKLHFGYVDFSGASLKGIEAKGALFQHADLSSANLYGAMLIGASIDADTKLEGVLADERTNFEGAKVLRPTSRDPLFAQYTFNNGTLHRSGVTEGLNEVEAPTEPETSEHLAAPERPQVMAAREQLQHLMQNAIVTRLTARQFASQIEIALHDVPASQDNKLAEPLQTMLEFADVLRNLGSDDEPLDRERLELRIAELEALVERLTLQLADETKAREAAEALAASDGFMANFRRSAGKTSGVVAVSAMATLASVGVTTAAVHFLGFDHPLVTAFLNGVGRLPQ